MSDRFLYCTRCGEEKEWQMETPNICAKCKGRRFSSAKPTTLVDPDWNLTEGEKAFLRANRIDPT